MKKLVFFLFYTSYSLLVAQSTGDNFSDSLLLIAKSETIDSTKLNLLNQVSFRLYKFNPQMGVEIGLQGLEIANKLDLILPKAQCYNGLGANYFSLGQTDSAFSNFESAYKAYQSIDNKQGMAKTKGNMGLIKYRNGDFPGALENFFKALESFEALKDSSGILNQMTSIGNIYGAQKNYIKSNYYDSIGLEIAQKIKNKAIIGVCLGNLASNYHKLENYSKAKEYYLKAIEIFESLNYKRDLGLNLCNLGVSYSDQNNYKEAEPYLIRSCHELEEIRDSSQLSFTYGNLGIAYLKSYSRQTEKNDSLFPIQGSKNYLLNMAKKYLDLAFQISEKKKVLEGIQYYSKSLTEYYLAIGDYKSAFEYNKIHAETTDSLFNIESKVKIEKLTTEREVELKNKQIIIDRLEVEKKRNERVYFILGIILLLTAIAMIYRNYSNQRKNNVVLEALNVKISDTNDELENKNGQLNVTLKDLKDTQEQLIETEKQKENAIIRSSISQDIHDDISSGLTKISWLAELVKSKAQTGAPPDQSLIEKISLFSRETDSKLGEIIWSTNPDRDNISSLLTYIRNYVEKFLEDTGIECSINFPELETLKTISPDLRRNLYLVIKESLNNALKYSQARKIDLIFVLNEESYECVISDNGVGMDEIHIKGGGNGLKNMQKRMQSIGGQFNIISSLNQGTQVTMTGPIY
ncbi:MAG: tetratricopeptide repeat protein [Saprospiraceae bacterium]